MKNIRIYLVALIGLLTVGCYNDFDTPAPQKIYTDADMQALGLTPLTIKEVKDEFISIFGSLSNTGNNGGNRPGEDTWEGARTKTLKFGAPIDSEEASFPNIKFWAEAGNSYIKGKVISSDEQGNVYKSLHIWDGTAAIELKLVSELYTVYKLNLKTMDSQWVYVRLKDLYLGNYRMMLSIGDAPSDAPNVVGEHKFYANSNIDDPNRIFGNAQQNLLGIVLPGERVKLTEGTATTDDVKVVDETNYTSALKLPDDLGRLIRFKKVKVRYAGVKNQDGVTNNPLKNGQFDNIYPAWVSTDVRPIASRPWYYWAYKNVDNGISLYGSVAITYDNAAQYTSSPGVYLIRTSGYARFAMKPIPKDGTEGNVLGLFAIYAKESDFTGGSNDYAQYQITVNRYEDLDFKPETLLTKEWIDANTPADSKDPSDVVSGGGLGDGDGGGRE